MAKGAGLTVLWGACAQRHPGAKEASGLPQGVRMRDFCLFSVEEDLECLTPSQFSPRYSLPCILFAFLVLKIDPRAFLLSRKSSLFILF